MNNRITILLLLIATIFCASYLHSKLGFKFELKSIKAELIHEKESMQSMDKYSTDLQSRQNKRITTLRDSINELFAVRDSLKLRLAAYDVYLDSIEVLHDSLLNLKINDATSKSEDLKRIVGHFMKEMEDSLGHMVVEKDSVITSLQHQLEIKDSIIYALEQEVKERDQLIAELNSEIDNYQDAMDKIIKELPMDLKSFMRAQDRLSESIAELESARFYNRKKKVQSALDKLDEVIYIYKQLNEKYDTDIFNLDMERIKKIRDKIAA